jgi:hypothetical protein
MSASLDGELAWHELWALRMHWVSCRSCKRFRDQLRFLRQAGRRWLHLLDGRPDRVELSPAARERIRRALHQAADE